MGRHSKLDDFIVAEMRQLSQDGKSHRQISAWCEETHGILVSHTTIRAALAKIERLRIAGYVAPRVRSAGNRAGRKIFVTNDRGKTIKTTTLGDLQEALLVGQGIDIGDIKEAERPKHTRCMRKDCSRMVAVPRKGRVPRLCDVCKACRVCAKPLTRTKAVVCSKKCLSEHRSAPRVSCIRCGLPLSAGSSRRHRRGEAFTPVHTKCLSSWGAVRRLCIVCNASFEAKTATSKRCDACLGRGREAQKSKCADCSCEVSHGAKRCFVCDQVSRMRPDCACGRKAKRGTTQCGRCTGPSCGLCGKLGHYAVTCDTIERRCVSCGEVGHLSKRKLCALCIDWRIKNATTSPRPVI